MSNWRFDEIQELLSVRADPEIVRQVRGTARDSVVYDQITKRLRDRGVIRSKSQVNNKLKTLKRQYRQVVDHNGRSEKDRITWCYFNLCDAIWGSKCSKNVALVEGMETASTSRSPESPYSDTEEQTPVCGTYVSFNNLVLGAGNLDSVDQGDDLDMLSTPGPSLRGPRQTAPHDKTPTSSGTSSAKPLYFWSDKETLLLLDFMKEFNIHKYLDGRKNRNAEIFRKLSICMAEKGFERSVEQIRSRWKMLKHSYYKAAVHEGTSGSNPGHCPFFEVLDKMLGHRARMSSSNKDVGIDAGFDDGPGSQQHSSRPSESYDSVDQGEDSDKPSTPGPPLHEGKPPRKRRRISNETLKNQEFLDRLQQRQQAWFAAQMRPFHQREERMLSLLDSLARTSERMVAVMTDSLRGIGRQHSRPSSTNPRTKKPSLISPVPSDATSEDDDDDHI